MNALEIRSLSKSFPGFQLRDINLTLPCGCIMGLIGENGAGKSTTIKLILQMLKKDGGAIRILGREGNALTLVKEEIGVVLDDVGLPDGLNPVQIGKVMTGIYRNWQPETYRALLKKLSIPEKTIFKDFSRGMKMKLGIAVAMSHDPKLLILDEATSGLDPVIRDEVVDMFMDFTRDETHAILISSHIVSDLEKLCDYIAFLHGGSLLLCEEKDRLLEEYALIHCSREDFGALPPDAVCGKKETVYGISAVVHRNAIPTGWNFSQISIEELFVAMVKEER